mgnify:CR=1 FL=1
MIHDSIDTVGKFRDRFEAMGRKANFTYQALGVIFEEMNERNESIQLDVIGICCEWSEYTLAELERDFDEAREAMDILRADPDTDDDDPSEIELVIDQAMGDSHTTMAVGNGNWLVSS